MAAAFGFGSVQLLLALRGLLVVHAGGAARALLALGQLGRALLVLGGLLGVLVGQLAVLLGDLLSPLALAGQLRSPGDVRLGLLAVAGGLAAQTLVLDPLRLRALAQRGSDQGDDDDRGDDDRDDQDG